MNKRQLEIINDLKKKQYTLDSLAEKHNISKRTIRNDLNKINDLLQENHFEPIILLAGGVIEPPESFEEFSGEEQADDLYNYKLSKEERKRIAATLMINSSGFITLSTIAETLYVSRATIIADLNDIKAYIKEGGLQVNSYPNKGLRVEGKESDKRWFLYQLSAFEPEAAAGEKTSAMTSIEAGSRMIIQKIINEQEQAHHIFLSDSSFLKVQKYIGIMLSRNLQGEYIEPQPPTENDKYVFAQDILKYISQYFEVTSTPDEVAYLSDILSKCRYIKRREFDLDSVKIQMVTRQFIHKISEELETSLENDYVFFESLSNHVESMFKSDASHFPENPVLDEIVSENEKVLDAVKKHIGMLEKDGRRKIEDVEITYIVVHVCAALERKKNSEIAFHVIVACHAGIGTSQLLMERLKKHFNFHIVDIITSHEASSIGPEKADLIISTVPLKNTQIEYVVVSPMLTDEDYIHIGNKIDVLRNSRNLPSRVEQKELSAKGLIEKLTPIVYDQVPDQAPNLMRKLRREIRKYFNQTLEVEEEIFAPALHHLLAPDHIQLDVECSDWEDAIRMSAFPLLKEHYIEEKYIDAMIENVKENGPYIVLFPGFAVPHEGVEKGSLQVGMNLIRLKTPVEFGDEDNDPVEFVCCLSAIDHKAHLRAFFNLVNMLGKSDLKEALQQVKSSEEAARLIERYEYSIEK